MTNYKTAIAVTILVFAMTFSFVALPAKAQPGVTLKTYPFIDAVPNPTGVGEEVLLRFGILEQTPNVVYGYPGLTITVVKPSGTTETLGPYTTDSTGGTGVLYTPTEVGTYNLTTNFPAQVWTFGDFYSFESGLMIFNGTTMAASKSNTISLIVQEQPIPAYPSHALPTEYWTRPIDAQLREWYQVSGNWVSRPDNSIGLYNDDAPETAHVLWTQPLTTGGLSGGLWGPGQVPAGSETGDAYEGKFSSSVILNGILYYQRTDPGTISTTIAVDLHTGEELWSKDNFTVSFAQVFYFNSWNYDGVYTYLWEQTGGGFSGLPTTLNAYDPFTGNWQFGFTNVPSGVAQTYGPSGEILIWQVDYANNWMALWNSTAAGHAHLYHMEGMGPDFGSWGNSVHGGTWDASDPLAYSWNVSIPAGLEAGLSFFSPILKVYPDRVVSMAFNQTRVRVWALSTKDLTSTSTSASLLFDKTWQAPAEWLAGSNTLHYVGATDQVKNGVIAIWDKELTTHYGFSVETGNYMWATESEQWLDAYGWGNAEHTWYFAYGKLFSVGVAGIVYAYDDQTGKTVWTYEMADNYNEPVTGCNWWGWITLIADGKVYVGTLEHSAEQPIPRGGPYICLNASNGAELWRVNGMYRATRWGGNSIIADSIIATMDTYDQRVYSIGKGPSTMTVTAPDIGVPFGTSVMIRGTVMDNSPGTKSSEVALRFANGVAAVSDDSQSDWMLYVYKQFERPANATGVPVDIYVYDSNNNYRKIGTTTSSSDGSFSLAWVPDIPGTFNVYATFAGSKAYFGSHAESSFVVDPAPEATAAPTPEPTSFADQYLLPATGGIIAAIAVVGIVLALLLRRK
jgi:PQQ-like domain